MLILSKLKFFVKLIAPLKDLTNDLSGSKYPTASMVYPSIFSLLHYEIDNMLSDTEKRQLSKNNLFLIKKLKKCLRERFSYLLDSDLDYLFWQ